MSRTYEELCRAASAWPFARPFEINDAEAWIIAGNMADVDASWLLPPATYSVRQQQIFNAFKGGESYFYGKKVIVKTTEQQYELINKLNKAMEGREIVAVDGPYPYPNGDDQVLLRLKAKPRPFDVPVQLVTKDGWAKEDVLITILPVNNGFVYHLDGSNFIYQGEQKNGRKILRQS